MQRKIVVKVPDGKLLKLSIATEHGRIQHIQITGDFFIHPEEALQQLEQQLQNHVLVKEQLQQTIHSFVITHNIKLFGITEEALLNTILQVISDETC